MNLVIPLLVAAIGELGPLGPEAIDQKVELSNSLSARVVTVRPDGWAVKAKSRVVAEGIDEIEVSIASPVAKKPPVVRVEFLFPQLNMTHLYRSTRGTMSLLADWGCDLTASLAYEMPLYAAIDDNDRNRFLFATTETLRKVEAHPGLREEGSLNFWFFEFYTDRGEAPIANDTFKIRIDRRDVFYGTAVGEASLWMNAAAGRKEMRVPEAALEPLYSTWYSFHQDVDAKAIEEECAIAAKLGMKTLIVDDGWQGDDVRRFYYSVGDWEPNRRRFPDFKAHVKRIHELGMKYMMWFAVPFIGDESPVRARFEGKYLYHFDCLHCNVLDPRFPEVRAYLISRWRNAVENWGIDGLKLDFIDSIVLPGDDPALKDNYAGRDIKSVPEATDRLLRDAMRELQGVRPDLLVEFRQSYIGPAIRQYGNMFRAGDCPGDPEANRWRIGNLRLTSGQTAVHADMLEWHLDESPEVAAKSVLNSIFGVIQYSVMLRDVSAAHRRMISHWLKFSVNHRETLLKGEFRPHLPQAFFPLIEACGSDETIFGVYVEGMAVKVPSDRRAYVLNATGKPSLVIERDAPAKLVVRNTFGTTVAEKPLAAGLTRVEVPVSGYVEIR